MIKYLYNRFNLIPEFEYLKIYEMSNNIHDVMETYKLCLSYKSNPISDDKSIEECICKWGNESIELIEFLFNTGFKIKQDNLCIWRYDTNFIKKMIKIIKKCQPTYNLNSHSMDILRSENYE